MLGVDHETSEQDTCRKGRGLMLTGQLSLRQQKKHCTSFCTRVLLVVTSCFFWNKEIKAAACFHKKKDRVLVLLEMKTALCREATSAAVCTFMSREA